MEEQFWNAVKSGNMTSLRDILAARKELAAIRSNGVSAIMIAKYYGQHDTAELLAEQADNLDIFEATALGRADRVAKLLAEQPAFVNADSPDGFQPLGFAAFFGQLEIARLLIRHGAQVNSASKNSFRVMPLHAAAAGKHYDVVRLLVENGADLNAPQQAGFRPLHEIAKSGNLEIVKLLVSHGADPTLANDEGLNSIDMARNAGHAEIVAFFNSL